MQGTTRNNIGFGELPLFDVLGQKKLRNWVYMKIVAKSG
jgi:hypothetical protein